MANKKLRFVALIAVVLMLVCMLVACTTTATSSVSYKVTIHSDGQSDIVWDRQTDFPTLSKEHHTVAGLYLDAEYKTAVTPEDLVNMFLTGDIDVYVKYDRIHYSITVHPLNGGSDVIWQNAPGNKIPEFKKVGYVMSGFYFDENCTQQADSVFTEDILENKEVWVKWVECDHKALAPTDWTTDKQATCTEDGLKVATCPTCDKTFEDTIDALGHNQDGSVDHKNANCTETGVVGGTYCTRCNDGKADAEEAIDTLGHSMTHHDRVEATSTATGNVEYWSCSRCNKNFGDKDGNNTLADIVIAKLAPSIVESSETEHVKGVDNELSIKLDALKEDLESVFVDGVEVDSANYTIGENGLEIIFSGDYLASLAEGEHTVEVNCLSGKATISFTVMPTPESSLSGGAIAGITIAGVVAVAIATFAVLWFAVKKKTFADIIAIFKKTRD